MSTRTIRGWLEIPRLPDAYGDAHARPQTVEDMRPAQAVKNRRFNVSQDGPLEILRIFRTRGMGVSSAVG